MTEFKVLKYSQVYMTFLGLYSNRLTDPTNEFFPSVGSCYMLPLIFVAFTSSATFVVKHYSTDIMAAVGALKLFFSAFQCGGMFLGFGLKMVNVKALHLELQQVVDEVENNVELNNIYWRTEQRCRKLTLRFSYFVAFHMSALTIVGFYAMGSVAFGHYDTSSWFLPFFMSLPFDRTKLSGWFTVWAIQFSDALGYIFALTSITSYFVSCCFYINAMCEHFYILINSVTTDVERMQTVSNRREIEKIRQQIYIQLCQVVEIQNRIYGIFEMLAENISLSIFFLLPVNAIFTSISMYDVEMSISNFELSVLLFNLSCIISALFWPAFYSYYASHTTDRIASIGNLVYESNWPEYPPELRKYAVLTIFRSQQPTNFTGLGVIHCTLEAFLKLCNTSTSYYLMFRALESR